MVKEYKFRGYKFRATDITTEVTVTRFWQTRTEIRPLYEIDGLKEAGTRPFLTSLNQVKDYIEFHIWKENRDNKGGDNNG
jgi:hypothetical protein